MIIISLVYLNELLENNIPSNQNDLKRRSIRRFEERISITKKEKRKTSYIPQSRGKSKG